MNQKIDILTTAVQQIDAYQAAEPRAHHAANMLRTESKRASAEVRQNGIDSDARVTLENAAREQVDALAALTKDYPDFTTRGFYKEAFEEYAEALFFMAWLAGEEERIPDITIGSHELLAAAADATGELWRRAVTIKNTDGAFEEVKRFHTISLRISLTLAPVAAFGRLRQKYDEVERNIRKFEEMISELEGRSL